MPSPTSASARAAAAVLLASLTAVPAPVLANPKGGRVRAGAATIRGEGTGRVDIHQSSPSALLSWDSFDVGPGEITQFHQPGKDAVAINRIFQGNASQILGSLKANGHVYLINPHGILFGREAQVNVHALIATTTVDGRDLAQSEGFDASAQAAPDARIVNHGTIESGAGGFVYLVAPYVRNGSDGVISSPEGAVSIEAGATVYLTDRTDGRGLAVEYTAPSGGEAVNLGKLMADGGLARLRASLVTQGGLVQANSVRERGGVIELVADDTLTLTGSSLTAARGGAEEGSHAGTVDAWSDDTARVEAGARIDVSASARGADGGFAEVSAAKRVELSGSFSAGAGAGGTQGEVLIDPEELVLDGSTAFSGAGKVTLEADREIAVAAGAQIDLAGQGRGRGSRQELELRSGGDLVFERDAVIRDSGTGGTWDVTLVAGAPGEGRSSGTGDLVFEGGAGSGLRLAQGDARGVAADDVVLDDGAAFSSETGDVDVEAGGDVIFNAGRTAGVDTLIESGSGDVRVVAEGSVLLQTQNGNGGNAAIRTRGVLGTDAEGRVTKTDGGDVLVWAKGGDVDAGSANRWVEPGPNFAAPGFDPLPVVNENNAGPTNAGNRADGSADGILGIGTEAGGTVVVIAGGDVATTNSPLARVGGTAVGRGVSYDGAHIGAFGVPVYYDSDATGRYTGAIPLGAAPESRVIVVAGGDVTGDYMVRGGVASLLAGYALPAGVDTVADLAALGLDNPVAVERDALRGDLEISAAASSSRNVGWVGTLADPVTVDLVFGSVDTLGRNGVAVRAVENPSLVYATADRNVGTSRLPTYGEDASALLEAETGDVVLVGNEAVLPDPSSGAPVQNPLVWLLPPSLTVRTNDVEGGRRGDYVQLEDFTLFPSAEGGLELDVAGEVRTPFGVATGNATMTIGGVTTGAAADLAFVIPGGTLLRDPQTGILYTLNSDLSFGPRTPAQPANAEVVFEAELGFEDQEIQIPVGTRVVDYGGNVFATTAPQRIPPASERRSVGEVRLVPAGGTAASSFRVPAGTLFATPSGALFETTSDASFLAGQTRALTVSVRATVANPGLDAGAGQLRLATPIAELGSATNRLATQRPAQETITFSAVEPGAGERSDLGRIKTLLDPVPMARFAYAEAPPQSGGADASPTGVQLSSTVVRASVAGPAGEIREPRTLELVDRSVLPPGVGVGDVQLTTGTVDTSGDLVPVVLRSPGADGRPDLPSGSIAVVDTREVWARSGAGTARLAQSDAAPELDGRVEGLSFDYAAYYARCRSGTACSVTGTVVGSGPTHAGDTTPAALRAGAGFARFEIDLAEPATLRAGPAEGEAFDGTQADLFDFALSTQHTRASDVTRVLVPFGDALFGSDPLELVDDATGLPVQVFGSTRSGITVGGPGALQLRVGVAENGTATGVGGRVGLSKITNTQASARGIETLGNLVNPALAVGGAAIDLVAAGNIELNDRGAIDTLQGGDISVTSLGGALVGGEPEADFTGKRGIVTLFVPFAGATSAESGGGSIRIDVAGSFDIGLSATAALSGGDIFIQSRAGSVSAGAAEPFEVFGVNVSPATGLPEPDYAGGGIFASSGGVEIVAEQDVDIGAGITGGSIAIAAGGNINAGQGAITSSGNVSIDAGGSISGTIQASGAITVGSGTVSQSASISAGGLVVGAGSVGSNTGPGKVGAETAVAAGSGTATQAAAQNALAGGQSRRSGMAIEVTSRCATPGVPEEECEGT